MRIVDPSAQRRETASRIAGAAKALVGQPSIRVRLLAGVNHVALAFGSAPVPASPKAVPASPLQAPVLAAG